MTDADRYTYHSLMDGARLHLDFRGSGQQTFVSVNGNQIGGLQMIRAEISGPYEDTEFALVSYPMHSAAERATRVEAAVQGRYIADIDFSRLETERVVIHGLMDPYGFAREVRKTTVRGANEALTLQLAQEQFRLGHAEVKRHVATV